jgi:hypothetical protein
VEFSSNISDQEALMKKTSFTESQIVSILKEADDCMNVADICHKHG